MTTKAKTAARTYRYVGPDDIRQSVVVNGAAGAAIHVAADLAAQLAKSASDDGTMTFVIDTNGILRVASRRSEHVACAGGGDVLSAGELTAVVATKGGEGGEVVVVVVVVSDISNQSTGYCPEPESWPAVASALESAGITHPGHFTYEAIFRRCIQCGERNLVKDDWFVCALCDAELPEKWNFDERR